MKKISLALLLIVLSLSEIAASNVVDVKTDSVMPSDSKAMVKSKFQTWMSALPRNVLRASVGPAWITSEFHTPKNIYKRKSGFGVTADYQHLWRSGFGFGINYLFYNTSFDEGFDVQMHYLGPSFVCSFMLGTKCRFDGAFGVGYSRYTESVDGIRNGIRYDLSESQNRIGTMFEFGIEYKLTNTCAIGAQINLLSTSLKEPENVPQYNNGKKEGISRADALIGLRYYF